VAQIFWQDEELGTWKTMALVEGGYCMGASAGADEAMLVAAPPEQPWPALVRRESGKGREQWLCVASPDAAMPRVNGDPVVGFRILAHRDVVEFGGAWKGQRIVFSAEKKARVETHLGNEKPLCPRCKMAVGAGEAVVRCPGCGTVHHQRDDRQCWTYGARCAVCAQPTALDAGLMWSPEEL
jgi:hypothetical protein